jgi:hypothetical protein
MTTRLLGATAAIITTAILCAVTGAPVVQADTGSYLADLRARHGDVVDGFPDYTLLFGGQKACLMPLDHINAVAPGMPALSAAVYDSAHRELCP